MPLDKLFLTILLGFGAIYLTIGVAFGLAFVIYIGIKHWKEPDIMFIGMVRVFLFMLVLWLPAVAIPAYLSLTRRNPSF